MKKLSILLFTLLLSAQMQSQVRRYFSNNGYLGLGLGYGTTLGSSVDPTAVGPYNNEYYVSGKSAAFVAGFNYNGFKEKGGLAFGTVCDFIIGGTNSDWYIRSTQTKATDIIWQKDFDVYAQMCLGLSVGYYFNNLDMAAGLRYYNCYSADALRSGYGNKDDAAVLGLYFMKGRVNTDVNYASAKIPGILVDSKVWDYIQWNTKFLLAEWDKNRMGLFVGARFEHSIMMDKTSVINLYGEKTGTVNHLLLTFEIGGIKEK